MSLPKRIEITEVGPRDGWQNHKAMIIPTEVKAKYVKKMIDAGADKIEVTAFVNTKAVPQMANAKDLVALVQPYAKEKGCQTIGLALNKRGVDDAVAAGVDYVGFGISVSEEHNKRNSNRKKINFDVCGLSFRHFVLFFAVVFASAYLGFMPTVTIYSNSAGAFTATTFVGSVAFLMAVGGVFFWLGNTIPILNNYLGGACLLPLLGASLMNYLGLVPEPLANGVRMVMKGGFQDMYRICSCNGPETDLKRNRPLSANHHRKPGLCSWFLYDRRCHYWFWSKRRSFLYRRSLYVRRFRRCYYYPSFSVQRLIRTGHDRYGRTIPLLRFYRQYPCSAHGSCRRRCNC